MISREKDRFTYHGNALVKRTDAELRKAQLGIVASICPHDLATCDDAHCIADGIEVLAMFDLLRRIHVADA